MDQKQVTQEWRDAVAGVAQAAINLNVENTLIETGSRSHKSMLRLCPVSRALVVDSWNRSSKGAKRHFYAMGIRAGRPTRQHAQRRERWKCYLKCCFG